MNVLKIFLPLIVLILGLGACELSSSDCDAENCRAPYGSCVDDDCECNVGFEGADCRTESRAKFIGNYSVSQDCGMGPNVHSMSVITGPLVSNVFMSNFANSGKNATAVVSGNSVSVNQTLNLGEGYLLYVTGSGSINGNTITMNCVLNYNDEYTETCELICTK